MGVAGLVEEFCDGRQDCRFYPDYSGRGMFGRRCVGIVASGNRYDVLVKSLSSAGAFLVFCPRQTIVASAVGFGLKHFWRDAHEGNEACMVRRQRCRAA